MALLSALRQIAGITAGPLSDALKTELYTLVLGTISLPINLPGTSYYQGIQAQLPPPTCYRYQHRLQMSLSLLTYRSSLFIFSGKEEACIHARADDYRTAIL
jgi:hypothetical protein